MDSLTSITLKKNNVVTGSNNSHLKLEFGKEIDIKDKEIALANLYMYYSWNNISASRYSNSTVSYIWNDSKENSITIPDGNYTITQISEYINYVMYQNGHYLLDANGDAVYYISIAENSIIYGATLSCFKIPTVLETGWTNPQSISLSGTTPQLKITNASFGSLIGFATGTFPSSPASVDYYINNTLVPDIAVVDAVTMRSDWVDNSSFLTSDRDTLFNFSPDVDYASQISIQPPQLIFCRVPNGLKRELNIYFCDEDGSMLDINDNNIIIKLFLRDAPKK